MTDKIPSVQQNEVVNCLDTKGGGVNCKEQTVDKRTGKLKKFDLLGYNGEMGGVK